MKENQKNARASRGCPKDASQLMLSPTEMFSRDEQKGTMMTSERNRVSIPEVLRLSRSSPDCKPLRLATKPYQVAIGLEHETSRNAFAISCMRFEEESVR